MTADGLGVITGRIAGWIFWEVRETICIVVDPVRALGGLLRQDFASGRHRQRQGYREQGPEDGLHGMWIITDAEGACHDGEVEKERSDPGCDPMSIRTMR